MVKMTGPRTHPVGHMSVGGVRQEKLPLSGESSSDILLSFYILLRSVHNAWKDKM